MSRSARHGKSSLQIRTIPYSGNCRSTAPICSNENRPGSYRLRSVEIDGLLPALKMEDQMNTDERPLLEKIAGTLEEILSELRKGRERHKELDEAAAAAEYKLRNPYENV